MSDPRKPSPYSTFNSYLKNQPVPTQNVTQQAQPVHQQPIRESYQNKTNQQGQPPQMQQQNQPHQMQQQNQPHQMQQQNQPQMQSRFKNVQTSEQLYNILTKGVENFQSNFHANNMEAPPMKVFLKLYTDWCGPCKKIGPILDEVSTLPEYKDIIFLKFDAELMIKGQDQISKQLVKILKIGAVPAFFTFIDGKQMGNVMGADIKEIQTLLDSMRQ